MATRLMGMSGETGGLASVARAIPAIVSPRLLLCGGPLSGHQRLRWHGYGGRGLCGLCRGGGLRLGSGARRGPRRRCYCA